jgi:hypothetical protein
MAGKLCIGEEKRFFLLLCIMLPAIFFLLERIRRYEYFCTETEVSVVIFFGNGAATLQRCSNAASSQIFTKHHAC